MFISSRDISAQTWLGLPALSMMLLSLGCSGGLSAGASVKVDQQGIKTEASAETHSGETPEPSTGAAEPAAEQQLTAALAGDHRSEENKARDKYRHPLETLTFFGLRPDMHVVEVEPGADAWYIEVIAPFVRDKGKLVVTNYDAEGSAKSPLTKDAIALNEKLASSEVFNKVETVIIEGRKDYKLGEPGSADMVVTFRNLHLWKADKNENRVFAAIYEVLKPGGVFGVVQHRANAGDNPNRTYRQGYLPQPYVIETIESYGFTFEEESHINANSWDTKDYRRGVWSLPPVLAMDDKDREKMLKIGESDRMTLRFRKPLDAEVKASTDMPARPDADEKNASAQKPTETKDAKASVPAPQ